MNHYFLDATIATPTPTPVFSLSNERSFDGSPNIDVVFANGKSDSMIFSMSKIDQGHFVNILSKGHPKKSYVTKNEIDPNAL